MKSFYADKAYKSEAVDKVLKDKEIENKTTKLANSGCEAKFP